MVEWSMSIDSGQSIYCHRHQSICFLGKHQTPSGMRDSAEITKPLSTMGGYELAITGDFDLLTDTTTTRFRF